MNKLYTIVGYNYILCITGIRMSLPLVIFLFDNVLKFKYLHRALRR